MEEENITTTETPAARHRHTKPDNGRGRFFALRQFLNIVFIIGAIAAMALVLMGYDMHGMIVAVIAMAFKMAECVFRYIK